MELLQTLLDAAKAGTTTNERITAVRTALTDHADADLAALEAAAMAAFDELQKLGNATTVDDLAAMEALADATDAIRAAQGEAAQAVAEQAARLDALAARMTPPPAPDASGDGTTEGDTDTPETGDTGGSDNTDPAPATPTEAREPVLVASNTPARRASTALARVPLGNLPTQVPAATTPTATTFELRAAADVPGYSAGTALDGLPGLAKAAMSRMQAVGRGARGKTTPVGIATIHRETPEDRLILNENDWRTLDRATNERLLPGGALTAAAGWCAPSETEYGIECAVASMDGMVDIPRVTLARGGVRWPAVPDFSTIWAGLQDFHFTEAEIIAGVEKPCTEIPCDVEWEECRLDVVGLCLTANLLMERGYPEMVEYYMEQLLAAHAHRVNQWIIEQMVALATPLTIAGAANPYGLGATVTLLGLLELQVEWYRYHYRMPRGATLEGVAPFWLRPLLRSDLAKRQGLDTLAVSDAQLDAYMLSRGVRLQYVYDWQDAYATGNPADMGGSTPGTPGPPPVPASVGHATWPANVSILLYPAGTYFAGQAEVITLTGVYDSTLLRANQYTRLFTEEGICVSSRGCYTPMVLTLPICPNGVTAAPAEPVCPAA